MYLPTETGGNGLVPAVTAQERALGRPAAWYRGIVPALTAMPRLKALVLWNSRTPGCNLQLSASASTASGYRQAGLSPYLRQRLP
jgi:hypothetical protein